MALLAPRYGIQKPRGWPIRVDGDHPFARGLRLLVPFSEGVGVPLDTTEQSPKTVPTTGVYRTPGWAVAGTYAWVSNYAGSALHCTTTGTFLTTLAGDDLVPADAVTIAVIRRKVDTTNRAAGLCGVNNNTEASVCDCGVTSAGDTLVHFYFGAYTGANHLSVDLGTPTTNLEAWIFTAGPLGSAMWRNGIKVASQSTAITRTPVSNVTFYINNKSFTTGADTQEFNFFQITGHQWSDAVAQWWSAEPYAHLYTEPRRAYVLLGAAATVTRPSKKGGKKGGGLGGPATYGPTLVVPWDSVNSFGAS